MTGNAAATAFLRATLQKVNGVAGNYVRDGEEIQAFGIPADLDLAELGADLEALTGREQDWLFDPAELGLLPKRGDQWITETATYDVLERQEAGTYRYTDQSKQMMRVFTLETKRHGNAS